MDKVSFTNMSEGTKEEYEFLDELEDRFKEDLPNKLLKAVADLEHSLSGYQISRLAHVLQSGTRAYEAGESEQMIAAALLHDIGDDLAPYSHSEMAASILRPFVSEEIYWVIKHHGVFQMYYYAHHSGGDRNAREQFKGSPYYDTAIRFCHEYDQNCFDPNYSAKPLLFFEPIIQRVFTRPLADDPEHQARYGA
ncbi:MAG: putative HD phosphohydrolase [Cocleimonas sp.]|jgi:predicted HD phosphohydrolase